MTKRLVSRRLMLGVLWTAVAILSGARAGFAQASTLPSTARIGGRVTDKSSGAGIPRAQLLLVTEGRIVESDSTGRYTFSELPAGAVHLLVRARDFPTTEVIVHLDVGDNVGIPIQLDSTSAGGAPQQLQAIAVTARAPVVNYRLTDFERRRRTGMGQYVTEEEIRTSGAANLQDATRGMRGITLHCGGTEEGGCRIQVVRARINCQPTYVVDAQVDNMFGPLTPIGDIIALEVYTGATDVPGEFAGAKAGCGVVAIWTRSGPSRRRR